MIRVRFELPYYVTRDFRPIIFYPNWPYWVCGRLPYAYMMVAYAENMEQIYEQWPHANVIRCEYRRKIVFNARYWRPRWYRRWCKIKIINGKALPQDSPISAIPKEEVNRFVLRDGIDV